jgi:cytoskeletal protein RodZ
MWGRVRPPPFPLKKGHHTMGLDKNTGLGGWSGAEGVYYTASRPSTPYPSQKAWDDQLRLEAILNRCAQAGHYSTTKPNANNDSADTAGLGRPFRSGAFWYDNTSNTMYVCQTHAAGAASWRDIGGIAADNSSSSSSSNSSSSSSSLGHSSSSSNSSSSDSTLSSSSQSSSSDSTMSSSSSLGNSSSSSQSSSSSTVAGNTSSSSSSP